MASTTKTVVGTRSAVKFLLWAAIGAAVGALLENIGVIPIPANYEWLRPVIAAVLGAIGKGVASYAATPGD